jgi:hypothetical protein
MFRQVKNHRLLETLDMPASGPSALKSQLELLSSRAQLLSLKADLAALSPAAKLSLYQALREHQAFKA